MSTAKTIHPMKRLTAWAALTLCSFSCATSAPASVTAWRANLQSFTTQDGQRMAWFETGPADGAAIVLAHGLPTSSYLYREVVPTLAAKGYRVIAPDLVGFGASSKPDLDLEGGYALPRQADRLLELIDRLQLHRVNLVVHDLGGMVAWELMMKRPQLVERLLVMNTTAYEGFTPPSEMKMMAGPMGGPMAAMMGGSFMGRTLTANFIRDNTGSGTITDEAAENLWWPLHEGATAPMRAFAREFGTVSQNFPRYQQALRSFQGPAALLWGQKDKVLSFDVFGKRFAEDLRIPPERVRALPHAGHFLMLDDAPQVSAAIVELMSVPTTTPQ